MHRIFPPFLSGKAAVGLLAVRLVVGAAFVLHGWPKIQSPGGPTGWMGPDAPVPGFLQAAAAFSEFGGGLALVLGVLTPLASLGLIATMTGALHHHITSGDPFINLKGGPSWELAGVYFAVSLMFLLVGPGRISIDALLFERRPGDKV
jgi:putative oxidoreductase